MLARSGCSHISHWSSTPTGNPGESLAASRQTAAEFLQDGTFHVACMVAGACASQAPGSRAPKWWRSRRGCFAAFLVFSSFNLHGKQCSYSLGHRDVLRSSRVAGCSAACAGDRRNGSPHGHPPKLPPRSASSVGEATLPRPPSIFALLSVPQSLEA